jgi:Tannase and feruloyl esterase
MKATTRNITLLTLSSWALTHAAIGQQPAGPPSGASEQRCAALAQLDLEGAAGGPTRVTSARVIDVPPGGLDSGPNRASGFGRPSSGARRIEKYCSVIGYVAPQNKFELRLPLGADWNHKFFFAACGGFCGAVNGANCTPALERGYAAVTTNGGHDGAPGFDGAWAANAPNLQEDFAWRSTHVVTIAAKDITTRFYGESIARAYMSGCSKGGQAVLMEAQRFPEDYDGLMPVAPVYDYTGRSVIAAAWFAQAVSDGRGGSVLTPATVETVHRSVLQQCGGQTGVDDGMVTDPARCQWTPTMIACAPGVQSDACLSPKQVQAIARLMTPSTNSRGEILYRYPSVPGAETDWPGWSFAALRAGRSAPEFGNLRVADQYLKYLADPTVRRNVDPLTFDFDQDPATLTRARELYDAASPNLRAFHSRGGKLLMWHGLADSGIAATSSVGYYEAVVDAMGGRPQTDEFFRLFLIPGVHHCGGGPGLVEFDALTALEDWVERGRAPEQLVASRSNNGAVERSRPIYPYPFLTRTRDAAIPEAHRALFLCGRRNVPSPSDRH